MKRVLLGFVTFLVICIAILLQINVLNEIPLAGVVANLGIVLIAGLGLVSGKLIGGIAGFIYGALVDTMFQRTIGIYILFYTLTGIVSGFLNHKFSKENKMSMVMLILIVTAVFETGTYFSNILLHRYEFELIPFILVIVLESAYNVLLTIILFKPIAFLGDLLNRCKNSYYLL